MSFLNTLMPENKKQKSEFIDKDRQKMNDSNPALFMQRKQDSFQCGILMKPLSFVTNPIIQRSIAAQDNPEESCPDCVTKAINATKAISADLNSAWDSSQNNTEKAREYSGAIVSHEAPEEGQSILALNVKEGEKAHSNPKTKGGEIDKDTDQVMGEFHTHPYPPNEINQVTGAYHFDGTGMGPSGGDFVSLASMRNLTDGYFMVMESGSTRFLIVVTNVDNFKNMMSDQNTEMWLNNKINEEIQIHDNMPKNPNAKHPISYQQAHEKGLNNALEELKSEKGLSDPGFVLLKANDKEKTNFVKIF